MKLPLLALIAQDSLDEFNVVDFNDKLIAPYMTAEEANYMVKAINAHKRRAALLQTMLDEFVRIGFGTDDEVNGGDCVDAVNFFFEDLQKEMN